MSMRSILRWAVTVLFALVVSPIITLNIENYAQKHGLGDVLSGGSSMSDISSLGANPVIWVVAAFLFGAATALWINELLPKAKAAKASIRFHTYGDDRLPNKLADENIWRWYWLRNIGHGFDKHGNPWQQTMLTVLFISFDNQMRAGSVIISSPDMKLPQHETKEFTERYVIITFSGEVPAGTIELTIK